MLTKLTLRDRNGRNPVSSALVLDWQDGVALTPRILITERIRIEWDAQRDAEHKTDLRDEACQVQAVREDWAPLVDVDMMRRLNLYRESTGEPSTVSSLKPLAFDDVTKLALEGFERNAFFLVVDGRQVTELDETIPLLPTSHVTFIRLVPLVGG